MTRCEYCGRGAYLSRDSLSCDGCGAPLPVSYASPAIMYDPQVFRDEDIKLFGQPRTNIPINLCSGTITLGDKVYFYGR